MNTLVNEVKNEIHIAFRMRSSKSCKQYIENVTYLICFLYDNNYLSKKAYQDLIHEVEEVKELII